MAKRVIDTGFWTDDKVVEEFTPEDKLFFLYLMTNPHTTQLGIYHINKKVMAFEIGSTVENITSLLDKFEKNYCLIKYSEKTSEVAIKNYLKHSIVKGGTPIKEQLKREIERVKDKGLMKYVFESLSDAENLNTTAKEILPLLNNAYASAYAYASTGDPVQEGVRGSVQGSVRNNKFSPPTVEEVKEYCLERGNNIDPESFVAFYESKGWMIGKNKMKNWKMAVITWEKSSKPKNSRLDWIDGVEL